MNANDIDRLELAADALARLVEDLRLDDGSRQSCATITVSRMMAHGALARAGRSSTVAYGSPEDVDATVRALRAEVEAAE